MPIEPPPLPPDLTAHRPPEFISANSLLAPLGDFVLNQLRQRGCPPEAFTWLVPATTIRMRSGQERAGGFLGTTENGSTHVIHWHRDQGLLHKAFAFAAFKLDIVNGIPVCTARFLEDNLIDSCDIQLSDLSVWASGFGPWQRVWTKLISKVFEGSLHPESACLMQLDTLILPEGSFTGFAAQAVSAVAMMALVMSAPATGGTSLIPLIPLGANLTAQGVGAFTALKENERVIAAQMKRSAMTILSWWKVLNDSLVVSIYESGEFINDACMSAMRRDKALMDKIPPESRQKAINDLAIALRQRIVENSRIRFSEVLEGSGIRLLTFMNDIQSAMGTQMRERFSGFTDDLVITSMRRNEREP